MTTEAAPNETAPKKSKAKLGPRYWRLWTASVISNLGDGVGVIAFPWLASAVTRNAFLIALIAVAQRVPWLVFTLPAGVLTDRHSVWTPKLGPDCLLPEHRAAETGARQQHGCRSPGEPQCEPG